MTISIEQPDPDSENAAVGDSATWDIVTDGAKMLATYSDSSLRDWCGNPL